jgi:16S rRNA (cytosine1402-N4)-methyltransferase
MPDGMHKPVMVKETVDMLAPRRGGVFVDATVGAGGHAGAVMESIAGNGTLLGIDRDREALKIASDVLHRWSHNCRLRHGKFSEIKSLVNALGYERVDGIIFDLGMSSMQLAQAERGFSFQREGKLDMRMDCSQPQTAADLLEKMSGKELAAMFCDYGGESAVRSRRIAGAILKERGRQAEWTTQRLVELIVAAVGGGRGKIHPATKTFQALRIAVNDELGELEKGLENGMALLARGGRMVVITYHSLEDRRVKFAFKNHIGRWISKPEGGTCWEGAEPVVRAVTKKPLSPSRAEVAANPRCRSAKMRCIERVG